MSDTIETQLFMDSSPQPASGGATYDIFNPARPAEQMEIWRLAG